MQSFKASWLSLLLPMVLAGCLLPQPDTPPIGPSRGEQGTGRATSPMAPGVPVMAPAPAAAAPQTTSDNAGGTSPGAMGAIAAADVLVTVRINGGDVTAVAALPVGREAERHVGALREDSYELLLAPGDYQLELTRAAGALRLATVLHVTAGQPRRLGVALAGEPLKATVTEEAELVPPSPTPAP